MPSSSIKAFMTSSSIKIATFYCYVLFFSFSFLYFFFLCCFSFHVHSNKVTVTVCSCALCNKSLILKKMRLCDYGMWSWLYMSQTSFSWYLYNQWTNFHKLMCTGKPLMKAICTYVGCTKATTNNQDIRPSVTIKALFANISWTAGHICTIKYALESAHQTISNDI